MQINLSTLNGTNGFVINGIDTDDYSGISVSGAGDVNGDNKADLIIGASSASPNGDNSAGESYVVFGKSSFNATFELSSLDGSNGFIINGIDFDDQSGYSVSGAGDVNGDSKDDVIIGAWRADPHGNDYAGESYVVFGKSSFNAIFELANLDGSNGFRINGIDDDDHSGRPVNRAGDVNGDSMDDIIIGAYDADPNGASAAGESYVVFGKSSFTATLELSSLDGINGFVINGINVQDHSGTVSGAGDVNGDSKDDLIIGAYGVDSSAGASYVVFGKSSFGASFDLSTLDGSNGFVINGIDAGDFSGRSVSGAGDVNGDGRADLIIGAIGADPNDHTDGGESYVVFGKKSFGVSLDLSTLDGSNGFVINGINDFDRSGISVSGVGDVNGDDKNDFIIGAYQGARNAGQSYVVFGRKNYDAVLNLSTLDGSNGFAINGTEDGDWLGYSVKGAGDVNGDGADDLIIGAYRANANGFSRAGKSYVVFGIPSSDDEVSNAVALSSVIASVKEVAGQVYEQVQKPLSWIRSLYQTQSTVEEAINPLPATAQQLKEAVKSYALEQDKMTGLAKAELSELESKIQAALAHEPANEKLLKRLHRELEKHQSRFGNAENMADIYQRLYGKPGQQRTSPIGFFRSGLAQVAAVAVPEGLALSALPAIAPLAQLGKC